MGMSGHAIISRDDGSIVVHLHPNGSIPMASQQAFAEREPIDRPGGTGDDIHALLAARGPRASRGLRRRLRSTTPARAQGCNVLCILGLQLTSNAEGSLNRGVFATHLRLRRSR